MPSVTSEIPAVRSVTISCRICGSPKVKKKGVKKGRFVDATFCYYQCDQCRFLFVEPVTDFSIYNDAYYAGRGPDPLVNYNDEYSNYASTPRRFEFQSLVRLAQDHLSGPNLPAPSPERPIAWLDFGCGAGGLLKYLRDLGTLTCRGVCVPVLPVGHDVGSYSERLKRQDGFEILDWDSLRLMPAGRFEIITCVEVIEHVTYPRAIIELLAHCLRPGGLLILTTGNLDCPLARLQGIRFAYCIPEIHVSLFTPALLSRLYREVGLTPVTLRHDGSLKFRFLKNLARIPGGKAMATLANSSIVLRLADFLFGVSAMPSAINPAPAAPQA